MVELTFTDNSSLGQYTAPDAVEYNVSEEIVIISNEMEKIPDESKTKAGNYLKEKREAKSLSQRGLAAKAKISYSSLSRIESGKEFPSALTLRKIAPYLSVPIDELMFSIGYSFQTEDDNPIYLDLHGSPVNLFEKALKFYTKNVELFFTAEQWMDCSSAEDEELVMQLFLLLISENLCRRKKKSTLSKYDNAVINFTQGIRHLIASSSLLLRTQKINDDI